MVIYDFECCNGHRFEGWFKDRDDCLQQQDKQLIACPHCDAQEVKRLPTASRVNTLAKRDESQAAAEYQRAAEMLQRLSDHVEKNFDNVGDRFAEEARRIHYGEAEDRNIRGQADVHEVKELLDEGISVVPLLVDPDRRKRLN